MSSSPYLDESIKTRQCDLSCLSPSHSSKLECCALMFVADYSSGYSWDFWHERDTSWCLYDASNLSCWMATVANVLHKRRPKNKFPCEQRNQGYVFSVLNECAVQLILLALVTWYRLKDIRESFHLNVILSDDYTLTTVFKDNYYDSICDWWSVKIRYLC